MTDAMTIDDELADFGVSMSDLQADAGDDPSEPAWASMAPLPLSPLTSDLDEDLDEGTGGDELVLAPERVRFAVPLTVDGPAAAEAADGVVVNLSEMGLACVLPLVLAVGERVHCHFRPSLGEAHLDVLAEVVWQRSAGGRDSQYGMRFLQLDKSDQGRIGSTVRERTEGRAGEWPLPVLPAMTCAAPTAHRVSPYVTAVVGIAVGVALSVAASMLPNLASDGRAQPGPGTLTVISGSTPVASVATTPVPVVHAGLAAQAAAGTPAPPASSASSASFAPGKAAFAAPSVSALPLPASPAPSSASPALSVAPASSATAIPASTTPASTTPAPTPAPSKPAAVAAATPAAHAGANVATHGQSVELTLRVDRPVTSYKTSWLDHPRRLIVDLPGARHALDGPEIMVGSPLASKVRVGVHPDKIRFVIYVSDKASSEPSIQVRGQAALVSLSPGKH